MPTRDEWRKVHADLMAKLGLPCKLKFVDYGIGRHDWENNYAHTPYDTCYIEVNPDKADFRVPEHLILHEAAHHRAIAPFLREHRPDIKPCGEYGGHCGHCHHWGHILCDIYREVGIALPYSTGFEEFARAAGIKYKMFDPNLHSQMLAVERNVKLIEGA